MAPVSPLVGEVMDCHHRRCLRVPSQVSEVGLVISRDQRGLPIMAMDNVDRNLQPLNRLHNTPSKEAEPLAGPMEVLRILAAIDLPAISTTNEICVSMICAWLDRARRYAGKNILHLCPCSANFSGRVPQTSASPPVFANGIASAVAITMCIFITGSSWLLRIYARHQVPTSWFA